MHDNSYDYPRGFFPSTRSLYLMPSFRPRNRNNVQRQTVGVIKGWSNRWALARGGRAEFRRLLPHPEFRPESFFLSDSSDPRCAIIVAGTWSRSIAPTRLSTHIFDCSANMPKFIPQPSSSPSDYHDGAGNATTTRSRALSCTYPSSRSDVVASLFAQGVALKVIRSY